MTNSDNTYGTHNKQSKIIAQVDDGSTALTNLADVAAAKAFFFTADALAVFDECCTELQWTVVDNTKLKCTMTFGTKGAGTAEADDWAEQYKSRTAALIAADNYNKQPYTQSDSSDHLF